MNVTIRKSVKTLNEVEVHELINESLAWMRNKYPNANFDNVDFIFSSSYSRSRYFRNSRNAKYPNPVVSILVGGTLYLYDKKSLGIKKTQLYTGVKAKVLASLIHELTHHAQYETGLKVGSELETTKNELEYLKEKYPLYYKKLVA